MIASGSPPAGDGQSVFERAATRTLTPLDVAIAATVAGTVGGLPSTVWAAATGRDVLEAARAAGTLVPGHRHRPGLVAGGAVHAAMSLLWAGAIAAGVRRRPVRPLQGAALGMAIATLDLAVVGRRYPAIRALPAIPQWCDHVAFGSAVATVLERRRSAASQRTRR
ncbi:MAG: hypothetical protein M3Z46_05225 [Actinomycetota bacterium]|nr:hypothetical protein [Actinomycetota bacterium]